MKFKDTEAVVIGDIHGNYDLLVELYTKIKDKWPNARVFTAGDICDRGLKTRRVVSFLIKHKIKSVRGNHDEWFNKWLNGNIRFYDFAAWTMSNNGGSNTMASYPKDKKPLSHIQYIDKQPLSIELPNILVDGKKVIITHAPYSHNGTEVDNWNAVHRDDPLPGWFNVCGHMIHVDPIQKGNIFYVDTGCGASGPLSAVHLPSLETVQAGQWKDTKLKEMWEEYSAKYPVAKGIDNE